MPIPGSGNFFQPTGGEDDMPQPGASTMSNLMTGTGQQTMQPPATPEEHANLKQGWMDWFHNPATASFLMQFGASMMQPHMGGLLGSIGQSVGEGGEAVGRQAAMGLEAQKQASEAELQHAQAGYYKDRLSFQQEKLDQTSQFLSEKTWLMSQGLSERDATDRALTQLREAQAELAGTKTKEGEMASKYPGWSMWQKEHAAWASGGYLLGQPEPKPENFGMPANVLSGDTAAPATAPATTKLDVPPNTAASLAKLRALKPDQLDRLDAQYKAQGPDSYAAWQTLRKAAAQSGDTKQPDSNRGGIRPPTVAPNP